MANFFTDRSVENPGRYRLNPTGISEVYDLTREEGTIYNQGTPLNAENLNDAMQDVIDQIPTDYVTRDDFEADIDTSASIGTTDGDLYNAINAVGWASNVISGSNLFVKKLLTKLIDKPSRSVLDRDSAWTSGSITLTLTKDFIIFGVNNLRRSSATNGYIKVASMPSGITVGDYVTGISYINDGSALKGGAFRVANGNLEYNTSVVVPTYGAYAFQIYLRG